VDRTFEQVPEQNVDCTDLESGGATIECDKEINDHLPLPDESASIDGSLVEEIIGHQWKIGQLHFKVRWSDGTTTIEPLKDMREDYSRISAQYIVANNVSRSKRGGDRVLRWAKKVVRDLDRTVRRIVRLYHIHLYEHDEVRMTRRARKNNKSKTRKERPMEPVYKYGVEVPKIWLTQGELMLLITILIGKMLQNGK